MTNDETNRAVAVTGNSSSRQAADIRDRWWWVEHSVWTERMLTRLEASEPTTKWFRLWDKVLSERNLQAAFWAVWRNDGAPGVDGQTLKQFDEHAETELVRLREELHTKRYRRQAARRVWIPKAGTTEKLLANLYLNPLDHEVAGRSWAMVRYADDFVVLCRTKEEAETGMAFVREWSQAAGLTLHPTKTRIVNAVHEGFDFLGWHFRGGKKWPRKKSLQKLQEKMRALTRRTHGRSLSEIVAKANPILRGWQGYFRESHRTGLSGPDGWLRRRLRALLRKREKRPGYGLSEADSRRWPNRWFAARGLFSLEHGSCAYG